MQPYSRLACKAMEAEGIDAIEANATTAASIDLGRNHTVTNEYYSLAVLLGDLLHTLKEMNGSGEKVKLLLPQNEGAEVDGQYPRFIRAQAGPERIGKCRNHRSLHGRPAQPE